MSSIGYYVGQKRKARELAAAQLGAERAACMTDDDVTEWIESNFKIFWDDDSSDYHRRNEDSIALMPNDVYDSIADSIVWLDR